MIVLPNLLLYKNNERAKSMYVHFFVPNQGCIQAEFPLDAEQLLRRLGATGRLVGFQYAAYMIERVIREPNDIQLITANIQTKKMIVCQLIERVDVFRGYELKVKFSISVEQFILGLDISA